MARKSKAVTAYLGDEMAEAWETVVLPRYGLSASAVLEQLIAREVRRIQNRETKEQALADIKAGEAQIERVLASVDAKLNLILYMHATLNGVNSFSLTAEEVRKLKAAMRELERMEDGIGSGD